MSEQFYENLESFSEFSGAFETTNYRQAPKDWYVIVTDIQNSTIAVESGKYKDVNLIGAACIGAVTGKGEFPFVFGGDGASFLVPPSVIEEIKSELAKIKNSARARYSLELRVGVIRVEKILKSKSLLVGKYELIKGCSIAKFSGGGLEYADKLIKSDTSYLVKSDDNEESSFDGISCRWNPVKSSQGVILTLIIKLNDFDGYKKVQTSLESILGKDESKINPIKPDDMSYMSLKEIYKNEKNYEHRWFSFSSIRRKVEIFIAYIIFKPFRFMQPKFLANYTRSMQKHSDFRKFDDVLRMVLDCSKGQMNSILETLDSIADVTYGYSCSEHALMTCLVFGLDQGEHIHFVDGANGGYTLAAKQMKAKLAAGDETSKDCSLISD